MLSSLGKSLFVGQVHHQLADFGHIKLSSARKFIGPRDRSERGPTKPLLSPNRCQYFCNQKPPLLRGEHSEPWKSAPLSLERSERSFPLSIPLTGALIIATDDLNRWFFQKKKLEWALEVVFLFNFCDFVFYGPWIMHWVIWNILIVKAITPSILVRFSKFWCLSISAFQDLSFSFTEHPRDTCHVARNMS